MKAVFTLLSLALVVFAAGLEDNGQDAALKTFSGTELLQREAREAEARKKKKNGNNGKKKKQNHSQKSNNKGRKNKGNAKKNEGNGRRKGRRNGKKKKNNRNQKRKGKKPIGRNTLIDPRQNSSDCLSDVIQTIKDYKKAANHLRMAKRVSSWTEQMGKKKTKAASSFQDGLDALDSATGGGASCNGGAADANATEALNTLKNCSKTAAALCDSATLNTSNVDSCKTSLQAQIDAFDACLKTGTCDCFKAVPAFDTSCTSIKDLNTAAKTAKTKCNSPNEAGSFGACSKALKGAAAQVGKCRPGGGATTTTKSARALRNRIRAFKGF